MQHKKFALLLVIPLLARACLRTGGGGGGSTAQNCPAIAGEVLLAGDFESQSSFYGAVSPVGTCATCAAGQGRYYPDSGIATPEAQDEKAIGGTGNAPTNCANLCVCNAQGTCYVRSDNNVNVALYPYCNAGVCQVYAVIVNQNPGAGLVPTTGGAVISGDNQVDANLDPLPVTSGAYPTVTYASCNGCPNGPTTCG
ncbi:unnamed protein product [Bursaphelenchus xylophilus]|uniref:(pine wood nematode) hypothetical protein n=1 Tax=Bursaphelenchus xylophilus TaxID=6326 RepID=A0A7I8X7E8_BURXY|nr:unnamed protein product [Bursaphelenchus xylophilus]CAG9126047.1 unnamed protein product [Bursaphelenchus xylophilus]